MLTENKNTLHTYPSLLPLRMALIAAANESPATPQRTQVDANEQCAIQLIQKLKAQYQKPHPVFDWNDIPSPQGFHENIREVAAVHAR